MKNFGKVAGALVLVGVAAAGLMYVKHRHDTAALGGVQPGTAAAPARNLGTGQRTPGQLPPGGFGPVPGGVTAADVNAWLDVTAKGSNLLGGWFTDDGSAVGPLSNADANAPRESPAPSPADVFNT